jgi:hypothetical protein
MADWWWYVILVAVVLAAGLFVLRLQRQRAGLHQAGLPEARQGERDYAGDRERARGEGMSEDDRAWELASQQRERDRVGRQTDAPPDRPA